MEKQPRNIRKILIVTSFSIPETAGSGIHAFCFARFINRKGDRAEILTFNRNLRLKSSENIDGVRIIRIPYFNRNFFIKLCSLPIVIIYYLKQIIRNNIIFIYGGRILGFELIILISNFFKKKVVFRSLMLDTDDLQTLVNDRKLQIKKIYYHLFSKLTLYFSINKTFSERFSKIFPGKNLFEMPQGVDITSFAPVTPEKRTEIRKQMNIPDNKFIILSVGFLIFRKGFEEIFMELSKLTIDFHYIVVGEYTVSEEHFLSGNKNEMNYLWKRGKQLLGDKISFFGYQEDLSPYYQVADVFLMNSKQEGLPNVMLEAMACKIPVITNSLQGINGYFTEHKKNAWVFQNVTEIHEIINRWDFNRQEMNNLARNAHVDIQNNYSFEKVYTKLLRKLEH